VIAKRLKSNAAGRVLVPKANPGLKPPVVAENRGVALRGAANLLPADHLLARARALLAVVVG